MADYRIPGPLDNSRGNINVRDGTLQLTPGVTPGIIRGPVPGHTSAWDPLNYYCRAECLIEAARIGQDRAPAAILRETGQAVAELIKGLLMMLAVVGATTAIGGAAGAAVGGIAGFFGGAGVGAAPGAAAGAVTGGELGMSLGVTILT